VSRPDGGAAAAAPVKERTETRARARIISLT
jgi:hypothetical protein